ncbi:lectin-like protein [Bacterioplanoides sp.]|uniref:lectin-like protein n=1 Tax=Bacterioplanoides sp. TaxID=2066072 RepID=UPI003B000959
MNISRFSLLNCVSFVWLIGLAAAVFANDDPTVLGGDLAQDVWYDTIDGSNNISGPFRNYETGQNTISFEQARLINTQALDQWKQAGGILFPSQRPTTNDNQDCAEMLADDNGLWQARDCFDRLPVACFNGFDWRISNRNVRFGDDKDDGGTETNNNIQDTYNACLELVDDDGVVGNYRFSAPTSFVQNKNLQTVAQGRGIDNLWINLQDKRYEGVWKFNLESDVIAPFWAAGEPNNSGNQDCAQLYGASGQWDDALCNSAKRLACYDPTFGNNGRWELTINSYAFGNIETLNQACQSDLPSSIPVAERSLFKFFAPITLSQNTALQAKAAGNDVWINATDRQTEGIWLRNRELNNWAQSQPSSSGLELCVVADIQNNAGTYTAKWRAQTCTNGFPVACSSGGRWYFSASSQFTRLDDFSNGQAVCDQVRSGYLFSAPKNHIQIESLAFFAQQAGVTGQFWINGNRIADANTGRDDWVWNERSFQIPDWVNGQPDGLTGENCAVLNAGADTINRGWQDADCAALTQRYLCRSGSFFRLSPPASAGNLSDFSAGAAACLQLGNGWIFSAPETYNENLLAQSIVAAAGVSQVWINATDSLQESVWLRNANSITAYPNWASSQPDNGSVALNSAEDGEDCVYQNDDGYWYDESCTTAAEAPWACSNGAEWRVTKATGLAQQIADGYKQCFLEYGADYIFAAPLNIDDEIQLDFARLLANQSRGSNKTRIWLNVNDGGEEQQFRFNLPFSNWQQVLYPGREPDAALANICAYKESSDAGENNPWRIQNCISGTAHYACFDGSRWEIATSQGVLQQGVQEIIPIDDDYWSVERGDELCKQQFGRAYYFSAPVTGAEEFALDATIRAFNAQQKRIWINYYRLNDAVRDSQNNRWFANRLKTGVWQKPEFDNLNGSDCVVIHRDGSWSDRPCDATDVGRFACFTGNWTVFESAGDAWNAGFKHCDDGAGSGLFAVPRNPTELQQLLAALDRVSGDSVWVNMNDRDLEAQWIVNKPRNAFWAINEPSNLGNLDCAQTSRSGRWNAAKCSTAEAHYACRIIPDGSQVVNWQITTAKGIWSQGFAACQREFSDLGNVQFYSAIAFGEFSAKENNDLISAAVIAKNLADTEKVWLNYSDTSSEGVWRPRTEYVDWGSNSLIDDSRDCAYFDREATGQGTWYADTCSGSVSRQYACTNGYEWRLATALPGESGWSAGFTACQALNSGDESWHFAAPGNAVDNARLKLAMELYNSSGLGQVWINAQDSLDEGNWTVNGDKINFPLEIVLAIEAGASLPLQPVNEIVNESQTVRVNYTLTDAEGELIDISGFNTADSSAKITLELVAAEYINNGLTIPAALPVISLQNRTATGGDPASSNSMARVSAEFIAPALLTHDVLVTLKLSALDTAPAAATESFSELITQITIKSPLQAAYNFNDADVANRDISGNHRDIVNSQAYPLPDTVSLLEVLPQGSPDQRALKLAAPDRAKIAGLASDPDNGLSLGDEYVIALRLSIEQGFDEDTQSNTTRGIFQLGNQTTGDQAFSSNIVSYLQSDSEKIYFQDALNVANSGAETPAQPLRQWLNVVYSKRPNALDVYIDGILTATYNYGAGENYSANNGDFWLGNIPGADESLVGLVDDIFIFNRQVDIASVVALMPLPPVGNVTFSTFSTTTAEYIAGSTIDIALQRVRGQRGQLDAYVRFESGSADFSNSALASVDDNALDIAFVDYAADGANSGAKISWLAGESGEKSIQLRIDRVDDGLKEGTELAQLEIASLQTNEPFAALLDVNAGPVSRHTLALEDLTPNEFGNFSIWAVERDQAGGIASRNLRLVRNEGDSGEICIFRDSGSVGQVTVNYQVVSSLQDGTPAAPNDFYFAATDRAGNAAIIPSAANDAVVFNDNGAGSGASYQCFVIQFTNIENDADYADDDTPVTIILTGLSNDSQSGAVLTQQTQAQLLMREVAQGVFGFTQDNYTCSESVPTADNLLTACPGINIQRDLFSRYARAAALTFTLEQATALDSNGNPTAWSVVAMDSDFSPALTSDQAIINFPEITPINFIDRERSLDLTVINDNQQEDLSEVFRVTINPTEGVAATSGSLYGSAIIRVTDVTEPANLTLTGGTTVNQTDTLPIAITRSGNANTQFSVKRTVQYTPNLPAGCSISDFINGADVEVINYTDNGAQNQGSPISLKPVFRGNTPYTLQASLGERTPSRVVTLGGNSANSEIFQTYNVTANENGPVRAAREAIIAGGSYSTAGSGDSATVGANTYFPIQSRLALRTNVDLAYTFPNFSSCVNGKITYSWSLNDAPAANVKHASVLTSGGGEYLMSAISGQTASATIQLPFTFTGNVTTTATLTMVYSNESGTETYGTFTKTIDVITAPRWRRIRSRDDSGDCLRWNGSLFRTIGCENNNNDLWTYDPVDRRMINRRDNAAFCATGNGDLSRTACNSADQWRLQALGDNDFVVLQNSGNELWCQVGTQQVNVRPEGFFNCSFENERRWFWD